MSTHSSGVSHWRWQRRSAVLLAPLTIWFVISLLLLPDLDYATLRQWIAHPGHALAVGGLVCAASLHACLGLEVIVEDYVQGLSLRTLTLRVIRGGYLLLVVAGCMAVLSIALGSVT